MQTLYDIFVDSSASLKEEQAIENNIKVISYELNIEGKQIACYEQGRDNEAMAKTVYDALREGKDVRTSLINAQKMVDCLEETFESGKSAIFITISSKLSGTHNQALMAAEMLKEKYPAQSLVVIDSMNASAGEGLLALRAAHLRDMGESLSSCASWLEQNKIKMNAFCTVDDLKYLRRGGRISATAAIAGALLNIKPILYGDGSGKFAISGKERGRKKAISTLAEAFKANVINPSNQTIAISHCDCQEDAELLASQLRALGANDIIINYYDVCTGAHIGPGTLALFFMGKDRKSPQPEEKKLTIGKTATIRG
jgi:DegV family protein with EDD domain